MAGKQSYQEACLIIAEPAVQRMNCFVVLRKGEEVVYWLLKFDLPESVFVHRSNCNKSVLDSLLSRCYPQYDLAPKSAI